ncbi:hypothetical protein FAP59_18145 [Morganella morganii]|nr:hypothetical protein [Morganella morganii]
MKMKLKNVILPVFMVCHAPVYAHDDFNSTIEEFDRYIEKQNPQKLQKPVRVEIQSFAGNSDLSEKSIRKENEKYSPAHHVITTEQYSAEGHSGKKTVSPVKMTETIKSDTGLRTESGSAIAKANIARNNIILSDIMKQNYIQFDNNIYFKILKQGNPVSVSSISDKEVIFTLHETRTDGTVMVEHNRDNPVSMPYNQLPLPLNIFIAKAGEKGKVKIYIKPEGGYGKAGIPGKVPPESMSVITIEVLSIK